jgi:hypothetical protein
MTATGDALPDPDESAMPPKPGHPDESVRSAAKKKGASLSPQTRDRIATQLRSMYDSVASQPVPDRFAELIAQLDSTDRDG